MSRSVWLLCVAFGSLLWLCTLPITSAIAVGSLCAMLNDCNGHGRCNTATKTCTCFEGWGASTDVSNYKTPDCSLRICSSGPSWSGVPSAANTGHPLAECSDTGLCDRTTGLCKCFTGYEGYACQRAKCPNSCSGHGTCLSMRELATATNAVPLSPATTYYGLESSTTWDQDRMFGCLCDSSWPVGLGSGQRQKGQYFGADCSLIHCPSGDDPLTTVDETDCNGKAAEGSFGTGGAGNLCQVDCANRGICDYTTGICKCFEGHYGSNCASLSPVV